MTGTTVVLNARLELLRRFAWHREYVADKDEMYPRFAPLFCDPWMNSVEDVMLAVREATAIGQLESGCDAGPPILVSAEQLGPTGKLYRITDAGYNWIKAHDAIGEAQQEATP